MTPTLAIYGIHDIGAESCEYMHDHNVVLMENGIVSKYLELDRYTRQKHDNRIHRFIVELLSFADIPDKVDLVLVDSYFGRAFISIDGKIKFEAPLKSEHLPVDVEEGVAWWFGSKTAAHSISHELAHVFSATPFFGSFNDNSLLIHFDGGASVGNFSAWTFKNNELKLIEHHWDMRYLSSFFDDNALTYLILQKKRAEHNSVPGKFMGFASWGTYRPDIERWLQKNHFFRHIWDNDSLFFREAAQEFGWRERHFCSKDPFLQDIAATMQHIFTRDTLKKLADLQRQTETDYLYYAGGCALNIHTNSSICDSGLFKEVFIPPCTNDAGLALGAAAFLETKKGNKIECHSPYLNNWGIEKDFSTAWVADDQLIAEVTDLLLKGKVIGVANGYGEAGPRALGNRSILGLANSAQLASKISVQIKKREWYRPIAPVMLKKHARLVTGRNSMPHLSRFMLLKFTILPQFRQELQGVVHSDGTARIQTIFERQHNPFMFDLLRYIYKRYKVRALINTSFNRKGEPIVHSANDAFASARAMDLDALVFEYKLYANLQSS